MPFIIVASQMFLCCRWEHERFGYLLISRSLRLICSVLRWVRYIVRCWLRHISWVRILYSWELCFIYWIQFLFHTSHSSTVLHHVHFALSWLILCWFRRWMGRTTTTTCTMSLIRSNICWEYSLLSLFPFNFICSKWTKLLMLSSIVGLIHLLLAV